MQTVFLSKSYTTAEDQYCNISFDFDDLVELEKTAYSRLSDHDKNRISSLYVHEYKLEIPDDYKITTAEQLEFDMFFWNVECEQFDPCVGFSDSAIVREFIIK